MGTPALPMAEKTAMKSHKIMVGSVIAMPLFCITKSEVTRMKAAQPFMLMVVQMGNTKRATRGETPFRFSADSMVTGNVAAELLVKRAMSTAGDMALNVFSGLMPRAKRNSGSTMKNWMALPPMMTATYLPSESMTTPAVTCADSCAAKATMPTGRVQMSHLMSIKSNSCNP